MKIKSIEVENFRNFKEKYRLDFPTDGRVSVIYGVNGAGKTTFHQLFQWIIYGKVNFNKTTSDIKYNLQLGKETTVGDSFEVIGQIVFEHPNELGIVEEFCIYRSHKYKKVSDEKIEYKSEVFKITKKHVDGGKEDWYTVSGNPADIINKILPRGLSQYFFFDGENMIADIKGTGTASAKAIRKALFSIFDLDVYEHAIAHIGEKNGTNGSYASGTLLSKLNGERVLDATDSKLIVLQGEVNRTEKLYSQAKAALEAQNNIISKLQTEISDLSEKIGAAKDCKVLNELRKQKSKHIEVIEDSIAREKLNFGQTVFDNYVYLLLSAVAKDAQNRIALKVENEHLISGVTKPLINALLKEDVCVCGNPICEKEKIHLISYFSKLPPKSYKYLYDLFKKDTARWAKSYKPDILAVHLKKIFDYIELIDSTRQEIHDIDEDLKISKQHESLIEERKSKEASLATFLKQKSTYELKVKITESDYKKATKAFEEALNGMEQNKDVLIRIEIMEAVLKYFQEKIESIKTTYSKKLAENIQFILNSTLNNDRFVSMTPEFVFSVKDEYGKEDKSEGQFAMVSFAYICGIFKLLIEEDLLKNKQYPLVLDGPFSKLDVINRQNIINELPSYAPQVIIFSKDDLSDALTGSEEIWTLHSNSGRHVAEIKKGYFPEVFEQ